MNYWPAEVANLAETAPPLFDFVEHLVAPGQARRAALLRRAGLDHVPQHQHLGLRGTHRLAHGVLAAGGLGVAGAALLRALSVQPRRQVPEAARLAGDERRGGVLAGRAGRPIRATASSSCRPATRPSTGLSRRARPCRSRSSPICSPTPPQAARLVGDKAFAARVDAALAKLDPGLRIGKWGQLQEWKVDLDDREGRSPPRVAPVRAASGPRHRSGEEPGAGRGGAHDARRAWRCQHWLEPRLEDQLLGAPARRRPRAQVVSRGCCATARCPISGTRIRRSRSTATSAPRPASIEMLLQSQNGEIARPAGTAQGMAARAASAAFARAAM